MILKVVFDADSTYIYIPDGFVFDLKSLENNFLEWVAVQTDCIKYVSKERGGLSFSEKDFLNYINTEVLANCNEKAFELKNSSQKVFGVLNF